MKKLTMIFHIGQKIWFKKERRPYTVIAYNERYAICTCPFVLRKTVWYTIIDLERQVRGTENLVFCMGFETTQKCNEALERLTKGESEVSYRNYVALDIIKSKSTKGEITIYSYFNT